MDNGTKLKELRKQKGITQKVIADYLGIKVNSYSQYENGHRNPSIDVLRKVAEFYNVLGADFMSFNDPESDFHLVRLLLDEYFRLIWVTNELLDEYKSLVKFTDENGEIITSDQNDILSNLLEKYNELNEIKSQLEIESSYPEIEELVENYIKSL
jgi:transcriptional regulator with XRE-family HTH domain